MMRPGALAAAVAMLTVAVGCLFAATALKPPATFSAPVGAPAVMVTDAQIVAARRYARTRRARVAFAVIDSPGGRPRGFRRYAAFQSASVSKAMLMVAVLRRAGSRRLWKSERALLLPMIAASDNDAADAVYRIVGGRGLRAVARAAGMRSFRDVGYWANSVVTPADQARLFYGIDGLVPLRHRHYARFLLSAIVKEQRWGIARVARRRGYKIFFKGGWRKGINHQVALLEKDGRRFSLAVMTDQTGVAGQRTEEEIAKRLLR